MRALSWKVGREYSMVNFTNIVSTTLYRLKDFNIKLLCSYIYYHFFDLIQVVKFSTYHLRTYISTLSWPNWKSINVWCNFYSCSPQELGIDLFEKLKIHLLKSFYLNLLEIFYIASECKTAAYFGRCLTQMLAYWLRVFPTVWIT